MTKKKAGKSHAGHTHKSEVLEAELALNRSRGDKAAVWITDILGSLTFLVIFLSFIVFYFSWNFGVIPGLKPFDDYPFYALDTLLSVFAITLSISVLISQNRQRRTEKAREKVELEVNVSAETEITKMLTMLHEIQRKMGIDKPDEELEEMKESIDLKQLHKDIGE